MHCATEWGTLELGEMNQWAVWTWSVIIIYLIDYDFETLSPNSDMLDLLEKSNLFDQSFEPSLCCKQIVLCWCVWSLKWYFGSLFDGWWWIHFPIYFFKRLSSFFSIYFPKTLVIKRYSLLLTSWHSKDGANEDLIPSYYII